MSTARKLMRLWGTEWVDGVEVLHYRRFYYPHWLRPDNYEKLTRYLGAYKDLEEYQPEGIESAWFYLNKNKGPKPDNPSYESSVRAFVSNNLNKMWWNILDGDLPDNLTLTASIVIEQDNHLAKKNPGKATVTSITAAAGTKAALEAAVAANYDDLWLTSRITHRGIGIIHKGTIVNPDTHVATPDTDDLPAQDPWLSVAARYAMRSQGFPSTIKKVSQGLTVNQDFNPRKKTTALIVTLEIPYTAVTDSSPIVTSITSDLGAINYRPVQHGWKQAYGPVSSVPNTHITQSKIKGMDQSDLLTNPNYVTRPYTLWEDVTALNTPSYNNLWYKGRLRADAIRNPRNYGHTFESLAAYIPALVDTGYEEEDDDDGGFFKKLVAVIVFVVVVVATGGVGATFTWGALATSITIAATVLTLSAMAFAAMGQAEWASAFAAVQEDLAPLIMVASIITFYNSLKSGLDKFAKEQAGKTLAEAVVDKATVIVTDYIDNLFTEASNLVAGKVSGVHLNYAAKLAELILEKTQVAKLESLQDRNQDLLATYEKLAEELYQENDLLQGFMHIYAKPATADWSMYTSLFDSPYERSGGPLALGNVQATTKQAMRKAVYTDPMFENILGV